MKHAVVRKGKSISLRKVTERDVTHLIGWRQKPEISPKQRYTSTDTKRVEKSVFDLIEQSKDQLTLSILSNEDEKVIGFASLYNINWPQKTARLGILLGEPQRWGSGVGTESLEFMLRLGFDTLKLFGIACHVVADNERAKAVLKSRGFTEIGTIPNWVLRQDNTREDEVIFVLDGAKWRSKG
jgi:RimJ/RimL family protein N-acetyltransferase